MSCIVATGNAQFSWLNNVLLDANIIMPELQYSHQRCWTRTFGIYFRTVRLMELYMYKVILKRNLKVGC